ncbi:hypothetical protein RND71_023483 [Anisodus tanguticus]|uniref:Uncharacterized protein n=1 Tax=Anisodus tanguticus TaxID=243964 RepID=A0AAE1RVM5_9SOLA|nr:hypothetical protein RND71_023483 [Anisodus tanguticus]
MELQSRFFRPYFLPVYLSNDTAFNIVYMKYTGERRLESQLLDMIHGMRVMIDDDTTAIELGSDGKSQIGIWTS